MGGRRKSVKIQKKEKPVLVKTIFDCPKCGYKNCVLIKVQKMKKTAELSCAKCEDKWSTTVRFMDEAIDVYRKWLLSLKNKNDAYEDKPHFVDGRNDHDEDDCTHPSTHP